MLKKFLFVFILLMSIQSLLNEAKAQERQLLTIEGIAFYFETDSVPQDVYLIPSMIDTSKNLETIISEVLEQNNQNAIEIYVQGMRWVMPNLLQEIRSMQYIKAKIINPKLKADIRFAVCRIYTDTTRAKELENIIIDRTFVFNLLFSGKEYDVTVENLKAKFGVPRFIEALIKD